MRAVSEAHDAVVLVGSGANKVLTFTFILGGCMAGKGIPGERLASRRA